jgi:hypothetical protein
MNARLAKLFKLQNPHLTTSYALPPQTIFTSAPYSVYRKGSTRRQPRRYTYAFVAEDSPGAKSQLVCFAEGTDKDSTTKTMKTTYSPSTATTSAIAIDAVPVSAGGTQKEASHDVLAIFANGEVICLSADLETVRWVVNVKSLVPASEGVEIEHASLSTARAASRGFLRNRQDITALLNPSLDDTSNLLDLTHILCILFRRTGKSSSLGLFQLHARSPDLPTNLSPPKHLLTWELPQSTLTVSSDSKRQIYSLHANTGALHCLTEAGLTSYDFAGTVPKLVSELPLSAVGADSFLRLSQDLLFITSSKTCRVLDTKYNAVQASLPLEVIESTQDRKRKLSSSESTNDTSSAPVLLSYYADLGQAVGIWKNEVVGFQLEGSATRKRAKTEGTRLIDSLGKGVASRMSSAALQENHRHKLDKYASKGKIAKYEELLASYLGVALEGEASQADNNASSTLVDGDSNAVITNGDLHMDDASETPPRKWQFNKDALKSRSPQHRDYAFYSLSRIFRWVEPSLSEGTPGGLKIEFFPPNAFQWLLYSGYLTKESVRRALSAYSSHEFDASVILRDGDITRAIVEFDPGLHILSATLNQSHFLPVGEVVQAIKLLMEGLDDRPNVEAEHSTKLLTNGADSPDTMDIDVASELEAANNEMDRLVAMFDEGILLRSNTLRPALVRLHTFPHAVISSTLRSMLSRHELESLVRLLHHEFRNGGWASHNDSAESESTQIASASEEADDSAVAIIASLLSCTIDAIGPATWITGVGRQAEDNPTEDLILDLTQATSTAITGFWEARYIRGLLTELLRYSSKIPKSHKQSSKDLKDQGKPFPVDMRPEELPMLPMGSKPDPGVERTKAGKMGKRKERSAREIGMLISQRVPKYSFERIVV